MRDKKNYADVIVGALTYSGMGLNQFARDIRIMVQEDPGIFDTNPLFRYVVAKIAAGVRPKYLGRLRNFLVKHCGFEFKLESVDHPCLPCSGTGMMDWTNGNKTTHQKCYRCGGLGVITNDTYVPVFRGCLITLEDI